MTLNNGSSHNAFYVERDITAWYNDGSLYDRINGTNGYDEFEGIFPGCWFSLPTKIHAINGDNVGDNKILVLGSNCLWNTGDYSSETQPISNVTYNHLVCCPLNHFGTSIMKEKENDEDTTRGGYNNSYMRQIVIGEPAITGDLNGTINQQLYYYFGEHLKTHREIFSSTVKVDADNNHHLELGAASGTILLSTQACLMSESEVYGYLAWSSSGFNQGIVKGQFPAFQFSGSCVNPRIWWWLRDVATCKKFSGLLHTGFPGSRNASEVNYVRPRFILA